MALAWLTRWAVRDDGRAGQFGLASLFFLTGFVSIYFAMVRWLVVSVTRNRAPQGNAIELFIVVSGVCLVLLLLEGTPSYHFRILPATDYHGRIR